MNSLTLKILLTVYILYALLKFSEFFCRDEEAKMKGLYAVHVKGGGAVVKVFDNVMLAFMHVYPQRFSEPLPPENSPEPPITALKMLSYSIQANPQRAWRELLLMTI